MSPEFVANLFSGNSTFRDVIPVFYGSILIVILDYLYSFDLKPVQGLSSLGYPGLLFLFIVFSYALGKIAQGIGWSWCYVGSKDISPVLSLIEGRTAALQILKKTYSDCQDFFVHKNIENVPDYEGVILDHEVSEILHDNKGIHREYVELRKDAQIDNALLGVSIVILGILVSNTSVYLLFSWGKFWIVLAWIACLSLYAIDNRKDITRFRLQAGRLLLRKTLKK